MRPLQNKRVVLGVTGGIAAYKSAELVRLLTQAGATVRVVITRSAQSFITPITLQALSGAPVHDSLFDPEQEAAMGHIALARWADLLVVAPLSANTLSKLANGQADNLLTTLCLATQAPCYVAPAMNQQMWHHPATQANLARLHALGYHVLGPQSGEQACGEIGLGRMEEPAAILQALTQAFESQALAGVSVVVTAGPTQEAIDPVRYLSNHSSGKMGYAMAEAAKGAGARVTLISGPCALPKPEGIEFIAATSAHDMLEAVRMVVNEADIFIATAAVADFGISTPALEKIKKNQQSLTLTLSRNPDILAEVAARTDKPFSVGFAAETHELLAHAREKRERKNIEMIIANVVGGSDSAFNREDNEVTLITASDEVVLPRASKVTLAHQIISRIATQYFQQKG